MHRSVRSSTDRYYSRLAFPVARISGQNSVAEAQCGWALPTKVERRFQGASTNRYYSHPTFPVSKVSDQNTVMEGQPGRVVADGLRNPPQCDNVGEQWGAQNLRRVRDHTAERGRHWAVELKLTILVDTGCTHSLISKTVFDRPPATVCTQLETWDSTAKLVDGSGLPVYGHINFSGYIKNSICTMEFLVSKIADEGILDMAFRAGRKCILCLDKRILV